MNRLVEVLAWRKMKKPLVVWALWGWLAVAAAALGATGALCAAYRAGRR